MRAFIATMVPEGIRKKITDFINKEKRKEQPIKWVNFENLHITLKFLGEISEEKKNEIITVLTETAKKFTPFQVGLEGIGCFPSSKNPRVLWIGVATGNEQLCNIANELEENLSQLGVKKEKRFHAHLTIGRIKKFCKVDDVLEKNIMFEPFTVHSITLFKSTLKPKGPIYEAIKTIIF